MCCQPGEPVPTAPRPLQPSRGRFRYSGRAAAPSPYPAFRFSRWRTARALCKWASSRLWLQKQGSGEGEFKGHRAGGELDRPPERKKKKMHWAALQQCFAAVKWSVLYFSERRFYSVCRSRLKCTQVRWQISWCAWFYFYGRHCMRIGYFHSLRRLAVPSPLKGSLN